MGLWDYSSEFCESNFVSQFVIKLDYASFVDDILSTNIDI